MTVQGINETFRQLQLDAKDEGYSGTLKVVTVMTQALRNATPVDTGKARDGWGILPIGDDFKVYNNVEYIDKLNEGTSKQAPANFIETTVLLFAKPLGMIVDHE